MEGAGGIGTVNELLLQSHTTTIELFPQVPPGEPAAFENLRARGGFVSTQQPTIPTYTGMMVLTFVLTLRAAGHRSHALRPAQPNQQRDNSLRGREFGGAANAAGLR